MLNILLPLAGGSLFFKEETYVFPKPLIEVAGKPMIERVVDNLSTLPQPHRHIFLLNAEDCSKFHLDSSVSLLTEGEAVLIRLQGHTAGAACSALMAIEHINNDDPLIISNSDQVIDTQMTHVIENFQQRNLDAGVLTFRSVHPRWSFVRLDDEENVVEAAEKRPLSKHAIAGFYYFRHGRDFIKAAQDSILKGSSVNGAYYIAPILNELILEGKQVGVYQIDNKSYHTFYTPDKIKEFEKGYTFAS